MIIDGQKHLKKHGFADLAPRNRIFMCGFSHHFQPFCNGVNNVYDTIKVGAVL
jgi:hypothetical protein